MGVQALSGRGHLIHTSKYLIVDDAQYHGEGDGQGRSHDVDGGEEFLLPDGVECLSDVHIVFVFVIVLFQCIHDVCTAGPPCRYGNADAYHGQEQ